MGLKRFIRETREQYRPVRISFGITVCNEAEELAALLKQLVKQSGRGDEILVLQDITNPHEGVDRILKRYRRKIRVLKAMLNNNFSEFKNRLIENAKGNYLFQVDADELLSPNAVKSLKAVLKLRPDVEVFLISRENYVSGVTEAHIAEWKWQVDEKKRINYPDYQFRVLQLNGKISWKNKVHEVLTGVERQAELPPEIFLIHNKTIQRQEKQNNFYDTII